MKHLKKVHAVLDSSKCQLRTITMRIDDVDMEVTADSGSDANIMDEHQFEMFRNKSFSNPTLRESNVKLFTLQNSLEIKGEFKTIVRNHTCGEETVFVVLKGRMNSLPLIGRETLINLGVMQIKFDGSFAQQNDLRIDDEKQSINQVSEGGRIMNIGVPMIRHQKFRHRKKKQLNINKYYQYREITQTEGNRHHETQNDRYKHQNVHRTQWKRKRDDQLNMYATSPENVIMGPPQDRRGSGRKRFMAPRKTCAGGGG